MSAKVELKQGRLQGRELQTPAGIKYFGFKGIPYAQPPIGDLRFRAPQPPKPWEGIRDATKDPNISTQFDDATASVLGDEDCLFLNVFTPRLVNTGEKPLPVMFFMHWGGYTFGNGTDIARHGPEFLVEQDVVVVSINYRLGILGFLCLDLPDAQGNMGLKDQVQALKWVKENIIKFGGDPDNVTIFGVSAGGASVEYLQLSPMARGLFHKGIAQSGSSLNPWAYNTSSNIKQLAAKTAQLLGKDSSDDTELLKYLKTVPANALIEAAANVVAAEKFRGGFYFGFVPTVEKNLKGVEAFLTEEPYVLLKRGDFYKVPLVSGFARREGLTMVAFGANKLEDLASSRMKLAEYLPFRLNDTQRDEFENTLKELYSNSTSGNEGDAYIIDLGTDVDFLGGIWVGTKLKIPASPSTYIYEFAYDGELNYFKKSFGINRSGCSHVDDCGYLMTSAILPVDPPENDKLVSKRMVKMWTNFAKFGNPTPERTELLPTLWEPVTENKTPFLEIDQELTLKSSLYPQRLKLFEQLYEKYAVLAPY